MTTYTAKAARALRTATVVGVMLAFSACARAAASTARTPIDVTPPVSVRSTPGDAQGAVGGVRRAPDAQLPVAITSAPANWHRLDLEKDGVLGVGSERALSELLAGRSPARRVIVAVIDVGVDTAHALLAGQFWLNAGEIAGNNVDDDDNGFVDDAAGWNLVGSKDGANVQYDTDELTRLYSACKGLPAGSDYPKPDSVQCASVATAYRKQKAEVEGALERIGRISNRLEGAAVVLRAGMNMQTLTADRIREFTPLALDAQEARRVWLQMFDRGLTEESIAGMRTPYRIRFKYGLDSLYNPRTIVGDANGPLPRGYGNRDVVGPDALHGTHVSGIIGAHWDDALLFGVPQHIGRPGSVPAVQRVGRARGPVD